MSSFHEGSINVEFRIEEDAEAAARACAAMLASASGDVALTGGSTPQRAYELAAKLRSDWADVAFWWGDERCVPPEHEWSNYGLAKRSLLDRVERVGGVKRIEGELGADEAAQRYDRSLRGVTLDLVLLGLGADGHAASLYPHAPGLRERERLAIAAEAKLDPYVDRVTLTIPTLETAPLVVWLVAGEAKAEAARRAFAEPPDEATPASLIRSRTGRTLAILDRNAARLLGS
jgi:6-phosphogluconolactonase